MTKDRTLTQSPLAKREPEGLVGAQGKDFSGHDFLELAIECQNFFESIFNGCVFERVHAAQSIFQHAEFTESTFSGCVFEDTSFDHSDFVLSSISGTEFIRCSFQNAEWRDADFYDVKFRQCIFRNTTTSLTRFRRCSFDDASAASFVGASKRFSLFSETDFRLPLQHISFLRYNFGARLGEPSGPAASVSDPLFQLALMYYSRTLTPEDAYQLLLEALTQITGGQAGPVRLRLRYLSGIYKLLLEEEFFSVFTIQLFERELSQIVADVRDHEQSLELIGLLLTVRVTLRERILAIEEEVSELHEVPPSRLRLKMELENTYQRGSIDEYATQLAAFCGLSREHVVVESVRPGSTLAEVAITVAAFIPDIVRFIKYSLSFATVTLLQAGKLRDAYKSLVGGGGKSAKASKTLKPARATKTIARSGSKTKRSRKEIQATNVAKEMAGDKLDKARPVEIFVDTAGERVLIVGGKARVTISVV
jgi:hypothetical protein